MNITFDPRYVKPMGTFKLELSSDKEYLQLMDEWKRITEESAKCNRRIGGDNCECCRNHRRNLHR